MPGRLLPLGVEGDQLAGELAHRLARAGLEVLPGLAAQLGERGRGRIGADVLRDLAELLVRDVEAVLAAEGDEEVVARDAGHLARLETEQLADAVILVDDVVTRAEVGERCERAAEAPVGARRPLPEDLRVGQQDEPELAPDEAPPRRRDGEQELRLVGQLPAGLEDARVGPPQQVLCPQRLARVREGDDDPVAAADEAGELRLGLGEPTGGDRRPLCLEGERLALRERVELGRPVERHGLQALLRPHAAHLVRLPDEVRRAVEDGDEVVRHRRRRVVVGQCGLEQVGDPLGRGIHDRVRDRVQRTLRERREHAHGLDLVAEELDAQRLPARRREDVDDAAADGELAALLRPLDALVPGEREVFRQRLDPRLVADRQPDRLRPLARGRQPLGERGRRGADEPAAGEDVEGAGPLADEVRRRLEAGAPTDAAAREQRNAVGADEPAGRLARVARVGVLGQEHTSGRSSSSCRAASSSASTGSETRARAGSAAANSCRRSCARSAVTKA